MSQYPVPDNIPKQNVDDIIGLPLTYLQETDDNIDIQEILRSLTLNSMPVMAIYPAVPKYGNDTGKTGLHLYHPDYAAGKDLYNQILQSVGVRPLNGNCLYVAFLNETSFTDSFSVDYSESRFEDVVNQSSALLSEVRYVTGQTDKTAAEGITQMGKRIMEEGGLIADLFGGGLALVGKLGEAATKMISWLGGEAMAKIASGSKVDFPMIWRGASYSPSYNLTVRLYNPNPLSDDMHKKYIIEPIAKILALVLPISDTEYTFTFPLIGSFVCPGIFKIKAGFISSVELIKGGDANSITFRQRPGIVDVRLTINEMYTTMIANKKKSSDNYRPTLSDYLDNLNAQTDNIALTGLAVNDFVSSDTSVAQIDQNVERTVSTPMRAQTTTGERAQSRVPDSMKNIANGLRTA